VLSQKSERRNAILGQLREVYDGSYSKAWGTGKRENWTGRIGLIAGVTEQIDKEYRAVAQLGPRFVLFRLQQPDRRAVAFRAMQNSIKGPTGDRERLVDEVAAFVSALPSDVPLVSEPLFDDLITAADLSTRARSHVERDVNRNIEHTAQPEVPARFGRQLLSLARGIASVRGHSSADNTDVLATCRVALDAIPPQRRTVLDALAASAAPLTESQLCALVEASSGTACKRIVDDLVALGAIRLSGGLLALEPKNQRVLMAVQHHSTRTSGAH
jgi:hypothetical protein